MMFFYKKQRIILLFFLLISQRGFAEIIEPFPYSHYCYQQAMLHDKVGNKREAKNWFFRYLETCRYVDQSYSDPEFFYAEKRLKELGTEISDVWIPIQEKKVEKRKKNSIDIDGEQVLKKSVHRERRKPSLSAHDLAAKAEKAEGAGQFSTARRYYRLALRLDPTLQEVQPKIKKLDEILNR